MNYNSTRDNQVQVTSAKAIAQGLSTEGGLFVPCEFPQISAKELAELCTASYEERAVKVLGKFLTDYTEQELKECVEQAYGNGKFDSPKVAPLSKLCPDMFLLELWHGPTCAFKDMALQLLPHLLTKAVGKTEPGQTVLILVATSGDTGKAALEGFKDVDGVKILVFYPRDGVSPMQKLQMTTQEGGNVGVCAIEGNFDDAQTGVKAIFTDDALKSRLLKQNIAFSSANSINWGRLVPQIVYYFSAYCDMVEDEQIVLGDEVNIAVPTGNFGNILAAYYAKKMGLPVKKFLCASNQNHVLTDFIRTGVYDRNREFYTTISPSMDILISSNLERLLYDLCDRDDKAIANLMTQLSQTGKYTLPAPALEKLGQEFYGGYCDDEQTKETIREVFDKYSYLCDTHTAVAVWVYEDYVKQTGDHTKTIIASTASPYKFSASVLSALGEGEKLSEFEMVDRLQQLSGMAVPLSLQTLRNKEVRFTDMCKKSEMAQKALALLGIIED